jgi:hypothetical protein
MLEFQTVELRLWNILQDAESDERWDSILAMENRFRLDGIGNQI